VKNIVVLPARYYCHHANSKDGCTNVCLDSCYEYLWLHNCICDYHV